MHKHILSGTITIPEQQRQRQLHRQLNEFANWMQKPKDANEVWKDKRSSVPTAMLPMVF